MYLIILMFQLNESGLRIWNGYFLKANVPIDGVDDFGIIVEREDLIGFVETVDKPDFLLICHMTKCNNARIQYELMKSFDLSNYCVRL
jgi:hypothetical protein